MAARPLKVDGVPINNAITADQEILKNMSKDHRHRPGTLDHLGRLFFSRYERESGLVSDLCNAIDSSVAALAMLSDNDSGRRQIGFSIGHRYWLKFQRTQAKDDIDNAINFTQDAVSSTPEADISPRIQIMQALGDHYSFRVEKFRILSDAIKAIELFTYVAARTFPERDGNDRLWQNIASNFQRVVNRTTELDNCEIVIDAAGKILLAMEKLGLPSSHDYAKRVKIGLARTLLVRYTRLKSMADLSKSRDFYQESLKEWGVEFPLYQSCKKDMVSVAKSYISHSISLRNEFELSRDDKLLKEASEAISQALEILSDNIDKESLAVAADNLIKILELPYDNHPNDLDLNQAFEMASLALQSTDPSDSSSIWRFENLSRCFAKLHCKTAKLGNLDSLKSTFSSHIRNMKLFSEDRIAVMEAGLLVELYNECNSGQSLDDATNLFKAMSGDPSEWKSAALRYHAYASLRRYRLERHSSDLDVALMIASLALKIDEAGGYQFWQSCTVLGNAKTEIYLASGDLDILEEAIDLGIRSLGNVPRDQSEISCMNLGNHYGWRYEALGAGEDIVRAVDLCLQSLDPTRGDDPSLRATKLSNYGEKLLAAYYHTLDVKFLDKSIEQGEKVEKLWRTTRQNVDNLHWISNYAIRLSQRAGLRQQTGDKEGAELDIEYAITLTTEAHDVAVKYNSQNLRAAMANNLAVRLSKKAELRSENFIYCMKLAISSAREAMKYTDPSSPSFCHRTRNLANFLASLEPGQQDHKEVINLYCTSFAAKTASARQRLITAQKLSDYLLDVGDIQRLDSQLDSALQILPQLQIQALRRENQQRRVKLITGLTCLAASAALSTHSDPDKAIITALSRLEQGRMLIFGSVLAQREGKGDLEKSEPILYQELDRLEGILTSNTYEEDEIDKFDQETANSRAENRIRASRKIDKVVEKIQKIPEFKSFRMPLAKKDYTNAAKDGRIIILCASKLRSDAIIIRSSGWEALHLPKLTFEDAKRHQKTLETALADAARKKSPRYIREANEVIKQHCLWMWTTFVNQILSHLGLLAAPLPSVLPRIHWICCDVLSTFPVHAAGDYRVRPRETAMKYCVSSYIATIKSLIFAQQHYQKPLLNRNGEGQTHRPSVLAIAMSETPGQKNLSADQEIKAIKPHLEARFTFDEPKDPTHDQVLSGLLGATIAHFACHGISHPSSPSQSLLLLSDYQNRPLTVSSIGKLNLASSRLAYLSACHSAVNLASELSSEAINIASAFQVAGFPSVIGTLWQAFDEEAVVVAEKFYSVLFNGHITGHGDGVNEITGERCARAMHWAVKELMRDDEAFIIGWASWIHVGD